MTEAPATRRERSASWDWRTGTLSALLVAAALGGATPAGAVSGHSTNTAGIFSADCQSLRSLAGGFPGDLVIACGAGRESCQIVSGSGAGGLATGWCSDQVRDLQLGGDSSSPPPAEPDTTIPGQTFGSVTGLTLRSGAAANILCQTITSNPADVRACVQILQGGANSSCPAWDNLVPTTVAPASSAFCDAVKAQLGGSVTSNLSPDIAWALFIDALGDEQADATVGEPGSARLFVCPGFTKQCPPSVVSRATVEHQDGISVLGGACCNETYASTCLSGGRYVPCYKTRNACCSSPQVVNGVTICCSKYTLVNGFPVCTS